MNNAFSQIHTGEAAIEELTNPQIVLSEDYFKTPPSERLQPCLWNGKEINVGVNRTEIEGGESFTIVFYFGGGDDKHAPFRIDPVRNQGKMANLVSGQGLMNFGTYKFDPSSRVLSLELIQQPELIEEAA